MLKRNDNGYVLITALLLLLVLTIVGMAAIGTSTVENIMSGNIRLREGHVSRADGGTEFSTALIERAVREQDVRGFTNVINPVFPANDPDYLPTELRSTPFDPDGQDIAFQLNVGRNVGVDIDRMYSMWIGGSAIEFAAGYEGVGKSGSGAFYTYYRVNATSTDLTPDLLTMTSQGVVGTIYRYVPK